MIMKYLLPGKNSMLKASSLKSLSGKPTKTSTKHRVHRLIGEPAREERMAAGAKELEFLFKPNLPESSE